LLCDSSFFGAKKNPVRSHTHCGVESFTCCAEVFHHGAEILKGHRPGSGDREKTFWSIFPAKQKDRGSKNNNNKKHRTVINSQFMRSKQTRS